MVFAVNRLVRGNIIIKQEMWEVNRDIGILDMDNAIRNRRSNNNNIVQN